LSRRREPITPVTDPSTEATLTDEARDHLTTIRKGWRHVLDPIDTPRGGTGNSTGPRPATEEEADEQLPPDARLDTPLVLAFWVHAALDEWPQILQTLEPVDPAKPDGDMHLVTTQTINCAEVPAMADLLHREAHRIATWSEPGHDYGLTFVTELGKIARAVSRVAWPPKGDRITIGECPTCGRRLRVKAPTWHRVPQPTTNEAAYPAWEWKPLLHRPITCRCGLDGDVSDWHGRLVEFEAREPKTATELIGIIAAAGFTRYKSPAIVRQWARQGLVAKVGASPRGESLFDPVQVLAALADREKRRDREAS
jgi:hypothetical protein